MTDAFSAGGDSMVEVIVETFSPIAPPKAKLSVVNLEAS
jgi:hypothetical protein